MPDCDGRTQVQQISVIDQVGQRVFGMVHNDPAQMSATADREDWDLGRRCALSGDLPVLGSQIVQSGQSNAKSPSPFPHQIGVGCRANNGETVVRPIRIWMAKSKNRI